MAYFDNAATTFPKPPEVYSFMDSFYRNNGGNAGRGGYSIAKTAAGLIADTRTRLMNLLHCEAKQVIFCPSATIALNMILQGLLKKNVRNIYITPFEHNAVTRVLHHFEQENHFPWSATCGLYLHVDLGPFLEAVDAVGKRQQTV